MKYYIVENNQPAGPFEVEELVAKCVKASDLVWCEGMSQWAPASTVEEIMRALNPVTEMPEGMPPYVQPPVYNATMNSTQTAYENVPQSRYNEGVPPMPNTWFVAAIIVTLCCCCPLGIPAIVFASRVETLWNNGRYEEAERASRTARKWVTIAFICGFLFIVLYYIFMAQFTAAFANMKF